MKKNICFICRSCGEDIIFRDGFIPEEFCCTSCGFFYKRKELFKFPNEVIPVTYEEEK